MVVQSLRSTSSQRGQSSARDCVRASCGYHGRGTRRSAARADAQAVDRQPVVQNRYDSFLADDMLEIMMEVLASLVLMFTTQQYDTD
ncbi:hypothetical protein V6N12_024595 [Hibiscus sabdariffa]|uniref:Uncharacterized protein n=1 Tax=Hibiscus sabdariffa TaxID=183260 RepID=A0ABR2G119_9ROSI